MRPPSFSSRSCSGRRVRCLPLHCGVCRRNFLRNFSPACVRSFGRPGQSRMKIEIVSHFMGKEATMQIIRGVIAGILLFLGHELNFLLAAAMAALVGLKLTPLLPAQWPGWSDYVFMGALAVIAAAITIVKERVGYFLSGFLVGGYFLMEFYEPGVLTFPVLPFTVGAFIGSLIVGIFTEWALMIVSCLIGAYYVTNLFRLSPTAEILVGSGLFIIGALTQVILMRMQKNN